VPTVVREDFEWDADKAAENVRKHGVSFEEAALAITEPRTVDFDDLEAPENLVTLAFSP
jgi:uncharacterized DUF497 family protein